MKDSNNSGASKAMVSKSSTKSPVSSRVLMSAKNPCKLSIFKLTASQQLIEDSGDGSRSVVSILAKISLLSFDQLKYTVLREFSASIAKYARTIRCSSSRLFSSSTWQEATVSLLSGGQIPLIVSRRAAEFCRRLCDLQNQFSTALPQ